MKKEKYTEGELKEIRKKAIWFKIKNFWCLPSLWRGHRVANRNPGAKVRNMSTITTCFPLSSGKWVYLVYAYPLSIIHRLLDGLAKWATEKYCIKVVTPKKWKEAFVKNSFIPTIPISVKYVVAMPYVENENLFDILTGKIGSYSFPEKEAMIKRAVRVINDMHVKDVVWGELVTPNMIRAHSREIILCDPETAYYRGTLLEQKASDWLDFICSAVGSIYKTHSEKVEYLVEAIVTEIEDSAVKRCLKEKCGTKRSLLHRLFFLYTWGRLACLPKLYDRIKIKIYVSL